MVNAKNDRYLSQWKYLSFFGIACCIGLYIIVVEKLIYEYRPKVSDCIFSESTLLSESEDEDKSVKLCTLVSAVVTAVVVCAVGGEIVPQAVIIIAIAAENIAEYIFFIHKFSFLND